MIEKAGVLDVISISTQGRACLVLPTLQHAIALWPKYTEALEERYGEGRIRRTKTARIMPLSRGATLRLWVPYERDPTMPMDYWELRSGWQMVSPYLARDVLPERI
jgi:hypothetical protein